MAKFCGKCGSKLDIITGLCPKCDAEQLKKLSAVSSHEKKRQDTDITPKKNLSKKDIKKLKRANKKAAKKAMKKKKRAGWSIGKKIRHFFLRLVLIILLLSVFTGCITGVLVYFNVLDIPAVESILEKLGLVSNKTISFLKFECLPSNFTNRKIDSQESALQAINDVSDIIGIRDVETELSNCKEDVVLDNTYYRFQQEYKGIPVYGRSVIVSADNDGNSLMLSGNYLNINKLKIEPKIEISEAMELIHQNYSDDAIIINEGLVIYSLSNCTPELAWKIQINDYNVNEYCFLSALSGKILAKVPLVYTESVFASGKDIDGKDQNFMTNKVGDTYLLQNTSKKISVYDAENSSCEFEFVIVDSDDRIYRMNGNNWVDESGKIVTIYGEDYSFIIRDKDDNVIGRDGKYDIELNKKNSSTNLTPVENNSIVWENKKAVTVMSRVSSIYDFWTQNFSRESYNDHYGTIVAIYNDYMDGDTGNASSVNCAGIPVTVLCFGTDISLSIDTIAHEFTHSVENSVSGMMYESESGALMEAYSDIFGEIIEDWYDGDFNDTCDWINSTSRNLITPSESSKSYTYPDTYRGDGWKDTNNIKDDRGGVHTNCTVISHAAYLMSTGIGGQQGLEALSTWEIAQLFYSTLYSLPSDCTFSQFRTLLQNTADIMYEQGKLTNEQRLCVSNAMFQVGISPATMGFTVTSDFDLCVYDLEGNLYDNYMVTLAELDTENMPESVDIKPRWKKAVIYPVTNSEPFAISLNSGIYELKITDNDDMSNTYTVYLTTMPDGKNILKINTTFYNSEMKYIPEESVKGKFDKKTVPSEAVEFNGHYYYVYDIDNVTNWNTAQEYCEAQDGYLATITCKEEDEFLYSYLKNNFEYENAYFGFTDKDEEGTWRWNNGEPVSYTNWHSGEPNSENDAEDYGMYYYKFQDGTWNDGDFGNRTVNSDKVFICEWGEYTVASD